MTRTAAQLTPAQARRRRQRGGTLLESALVLLVVIIVLIGILDMGQVLFQRASVMERMRAAVRTGSITYDPDSVRNYILYGTTTPANGATPAFNLTADMVSVTRLDQNTSADRVQVVVSNYPIDFYTPLIAGRVTGPAIEVVAPMELASVP